MPCDFTGPDLASEPSVFSYPVDFVDKVYQCFFDKLVLKILVVSSHGNSISDLRWGFFCRM